MKRFILLFVLFQTLLFPQTESEEFNKKFNSILSHPFFNSSLLAIDVYDLTEDETLLRMNERLLLRPASNMKLFTSAAGLLYLDPNYNFTTHFYFDGNIVDSTFYGDIIVEGGFDPEFKYEYLDSVIHFIEQHGIKNINGRILADISKTDSLYWGRGWMWDDNPAGFQPYLSSLNINYNNVEVIYEPAKIGEPAIVKLYPPSGYFSLENTLITTKEDTSDILITRDWLNNSNKIIAGGDISHKAEIDTAKVNVLQPELFFLTLFEEKLTQQNISVIAEIDTGSITGSAKLFYTHRTPLLQVINEMNKESNNLHAECILRVLAEEYFDPSYKAEKGLKLIDSLVIDMGYDPEDFVFADGSGLSFYNLVSAELITGLLKYFYFEHSTQYIHLINSLPVAGKNGTLENRMKYGPTYNNVKAKTGTISGVSALSGYLTTRQNHLLAFSILIQNYSGKAGMPRRFQDKICELLIEYF